MWRGDGARDGPDFRIGFRAWADTLVPPRESPAAVLIMNIIIVGAGEIGRHLASSLSQEAHAISVIESDALLAEELDASIDAKLVTGDGTSVASLADADVGECELFLALTSSNTANLMSASMAKSMGVAEGGEPGASLVAARGVVV
jgi:voltage-gated potassium channel Kch